MAPLEEISTVDDKNLVDLPNNCHKTWWKDPGLRRLNLAVLVMFSSAAANGFDSSLINGLLIVQSFRHVFDITETNDNAKFVGLMIASLSFGGLAAFIPASYVSDYFGRKFCTGLGSALMAFAAICQAAFKGRTSFLITRVFLGIGLGFAQTAAPPLTTEIAHPRQRAGITIFFQAVWYWGSILSACATLAALKFAPNDDWGWRIPCIIQAFFPLVQTFGLLIVPESPRWLIANGDEKAGLKMLAKYHANGLETDVMVAHEFNGIKDALSREKKGAKRPGFQEFLLTPGNRLRLFICVMVGIIIQWTGNGIISYYLFPMLQTVGMTSHQEAAILNVALQIWNAVLAAFGAYCCDRFGRRPLWLTSAFGMAIAFTIIGAVSASYAQLVYEMTGSSIVSDATIPMDSWHGKAIIALVFIFFGFYDIAFTPLAIAYPVEILPYRLRAKGLALNLTVVFAAGCLTQFTNPIALKAIQWKLYFVYVGLLAIWIAVIYFTFPETKDRSLEDIAEIFDGPDGKGPQLLKRHATLLRGIEKRLDSLALAGGFSLWKAGKREGDSRQRMIQDESPPGAAAEVFREKPITNNTR